MGIEEVAKLPVEVYMATLDRHFDEGNVENTEHRLAEEIFDQTQLKKIQSLFVKKRRPLKIWVSDSSVSSDWRQYEERTLAVYLIYNPKSPVDDVHSQDKCIHRYQWFERYWKEKIIPNKGTYKLLKEINFTVICTTI